MYSFEHDVQPSSFQTLTNNNLDIEMLQSQKQTETDDYYLDITSNNKMNSKIFNYYESIQISKTFLYMHKRLIFILLHFYSNTQIRETKTSF